MAEEQDDSPKGSKKDWPETHKKGMQEYDRAYQRERNNIDEAYEDLRFRRGRTEDQWTAEALEARKGRPCHVVNKLPQFIRQVTGDIRQMRPSVKVVPVDSGADIKTAEVRGGIIRYVENRSYAKHIYTAAADSQVACGIGHWQVLTEYAAANTKNQEIRVAGIEDCVSVLWDADSVMPTREDADHCFVPTDMTTAKFKERWPNAQSSGFDIAAAGLQNSSSFTNWSADDYIRVCAYWKKKPTKKTFAFFPDGSVDDITDQVKDSAPEAVKQGIAFLEQQGAKIEERDDFKICRYLMTMAEILEEQEWPGMYIPIVPVIGEEVRIGREVYRHGVVRYARDLQRMENYYASAETEVVALQPKAPWIGTKKNFQDHYDLWETANTENHPFLEFTPDPQFPSGPQRVAPPVASQAIIEGKARNSEDMKAVIGIYDASLGAKSNETSGVAIARRQHEGDTGTFVYIDNFSLAIQRTGQIINDLIPHIYDVQRQMRIIGEDGKPDVVDINKPQIIDGAEKTQHDMTVGSYDVMIEQGPSYSTKREESREAMQAFIQALPAAAPLVADQYAKVHDFPEAEKFGERMEYLMPPELRQKLEQERQQQEQKNGAPPSPEQIQQAQAQQQQQEMAAKAQQMQFEEAEAKVMEAKAKAEKAAQDARKAKADADRAEAEAEKAKANVADNTMEHLRKIEKHDAEMNQMHAAHEREDAHAADKHEVDMTRQGLEEYRAIQAAEQNAEKHGETLKQMKQPKKEPA